MSLRKVINWEGAKAEGNLSGTVASPWHQVYNYYDNSWTWCCDVDIGAEEVLRDIPLAVNNRDILYAEVGKPVSLQKAAQGTYAITGLSKTIMGNTHILYVNFTDAVGAVTADLFQGRTIRRLTYDELALYGGYGVVSYGAVGLFAPDGTFVELVH